MTETDPIAVPRGEHGVIRVVALNLAEQEAVQLDSADGTGLSDLLGVERLNAEYVDVVRVRDLEGLGLTGLLEDGHGVEESELAADRDKLNALSGVVLVVTSAAFEGRATRLAPSEKATLIGAYPTAQAKPGIGMLSAGRDGDVADAPVVEQSAPDTPTGARTWIIALIGLGLAAVLVLALVR